MGNKLPKEQAKSERTKLCPIKALVFFKCSELCEVNSLIESSAWTESEILIHQSSIRLSNSTLSASTDINDSFLIIYQDQVTLEVSFLLNKRNEIFIVRFLNLRQFKDVVQALFVSKRPSWILSPVCQCCSREFSILTRNHHCRNCGKHICGNCSAFTSLEISGYLGQQRVCSVCISNILELTGSIHRIRGRSFQVTSNNLYFLSDRDSVLGSSLKLG